MHTNFNWDNETHANRRKIDALTWLGSNWERASVSNLYCAIF